MEINLFLEWLKEKGVTGYQENSKKSYLDLRIWVHPSSKKPRVQMNDEGKIHVYIKSPPVQGAANKATIESLSSFFHLPKSRIDIIKGTLSREKVVRIIF